MTAKRGYALFNAVTVSWAQRPQLYIYEVSVLVSVRRTVMAMHSPGHKWSILLHMYSKNVYELLPGMNLAYDSFKTVIMQCYNIFF